MCTVSMIMDHYGDKWEKLRTFAVPVGLPTQPSPLMPGQNPSIHPSSPQGATFPAPSVTIFPPAPAISLAEIEEFRQLLERARKYDRDNNEPDCELDEKRDRVKRLADELGVKIDFL